MTFLQELQLYQEKMDAAKADLKTLYLNSEDKGTWAVAWSGGKDSTCVLKLITEVVMALPVEQRQRHVYVVMSDTVVENPELDLYMREQQQLFNQWATKNKAPFSAHIVERPVEKGYFFCLLGKGHPLPSQSIRWCTDRLKIKPQDNFFLEITPTYVLSGVRRSESQTRERKIDRYSIEEKVALYEHSKLTPLGTKVFMPIINFDVEDVWRSLREPTLWGSTEDIRRIYKDATGECGFSNPKGTEEKGVEVCGARFGCWTCPVVVKDKSTEQMAKIHDWMLPLTEWRKLHMQVHGRYKPTRYEGQVRKDRSLTIKKFKAIQYAILRMTKAGFGRRGKEYNLGAGTLSLEARIFLTKELLKTIEKVNTMRMTQGLEPLEIIRDDEYQAICKQQQEDLLEREWLHQNKMKIPFDRKMLFENMDERETADIAKLNHLSPDEIADKIVENFSKGIFEFPTE